MIKTNFSAQDAVELLHNWPSAQVFKGGNPNNKIPGVL